MAGSVAVFALIGALALLALFAWFDAREERSAFASLAQANARFLDQSPLPRSVQMAAQLSEVTDASVFFLDATSGMAIGNVEPALAAAARDLAADGVASSRGTQWMAVHGLRDGARIVFARSRKPVFGALSRPDTWLALAVFAGLAIAFGVWMARRVAQPLQALAAQISAPGDVLRLPATVLARGDEIGQLARALDDEHERRRRAERLAILGRMVTSLAHEVRNPVAAIKLHAELMASATEGDANASARHIHEAAGRIESQVQQWMTFARPEPPAKRECDLGSLVREVMSSLAAQAAHMRCTCELLPHEPVMISADCQRLRQVVANVLLNALQAMPHGGAVMVTIQREGDQWQVTVQDQGRGFSERALAALGEPFHSEKEGGMGLGIAMAREVCRAHGGDLKALNTEGGARVVLAFGT
jgi:signal transduction histidine kinase